MILQLVNPQLRSGGNRINPSSSGMALLLVASSSYHSFPIKHPPDTPRVPLEDLNNGNDSD